MSVLGVRVPVTWDVSVLFKVLRKTFGLQFTFQSFKNYSMNKTLKTAFIRLSEKEDPQLVIKLLQGRYIKETGLPYKAFIVDEMPDIEPHQIIPKKIPKVLRMYKMSPGSAVPSSHYELMAELQYKYNRLNQLSREKTDDKLMEELSKTVFTRLVEVSQCHPNVQKPFQLTSAYRRAHPHDEDFALILDTLWRLDEEAGRPTTKVAKHDLIDTTPPSTDIDNIPFEKVEEACRRLTNTMTKKVQDHVAGLSCEDNDDLGPARKRVRTEIKNIAPYLPMMIKQVMVRHLIPGNIMSYKVRIYGEPFLPGQEVMRGVLKEFNPFNVQRVQAMYNLLWFNVTPDALPGLMRLDKHAAGSDCKLIIRVSREKLYTTPRHVMEELKRSLDL